jgi:ketosteroid isomerase-like protein
VILAEPTPEHAADVIAINHLAVAYAEAVCRFEIEEACEVYAPDGVLSSPTTEDAVGPAAIAALIRQTVAPFDFIFQTVHLGLVHVDGDRAAARFPITEWGRRTRDGASVQFLGVYDDDVVRTPDGWRFSHRRLVPRTLGKPDSFTGRVHDLSGLRASL